MLGRHAWQRRWFTLSLSASPQRGHEILLAYFKTDEDAGAGKEPLGEIVLNDIMSVNVIKEKVRRGGRRHTEKGSRL